VTKRRRRTGRARAGDGVAAGPAPEAIDAVAPFARGYLHEDLRAEFGSAAAAAAAFAADASDAERARVRDGWDQILRWARTADRDALRGLFRDRLRCAWAPEAASDLDPIATRLALRP
jgi:hypothetical protein